MSLIESMSQNIQCLENIREPNNEYIDATEEFRGSVGSAMRYFTEHPDDRRKVKSFLTTCR